jgi:hypothetical protein
MSAHSEFTMPKRFLAAVLVVACGAAASGQTRTGVSRTPWGHPDLQGRWTNATVTLVERPVEFGAKEFFTAEEAAEYSKTALERFLAATDATPRWTALRVRVPRGESRAGEHPQRRSSD